MEKYTIGPNRTCPLNVYCSEPRPGVLCPGDSCLYVVSGATTSMFPHQNWQWFPLNNPGIISIPFGFLCGWLGALLSSEKNPEKYAELEVRSLTGVGAH